VFDVLYSVKAIVMVLLGGAGSMFGPLIGAALADDPAIREAYLGVI
jgi:ABC-type branched-subunit amino acid transport system permease subunit